MAATLEHGPASTLHSPVHKLRSAKRSWTSTGKAAATTRRCPQVYERIRVLCPNWFQLVLGMRVINSASSISINFRVDGHETCEGTWQAFHGVPNATMDSITRTVLGGATVWNNKLQQQVASAHRAETGHLRRAAQAWWAIRLDYYECIVDQGKILYPQNTDWRLVYDEEFVPEMQSMGHDWRKSDRTGGSVGSTSTWYEGRAAALKQRALDHIGPEAKPFQFKSRAKHSANVSVPPLLLPILLHLTRPSAHCAALPTPTFCAIRKNAADAKSLGFELRRPSS